MRTAGGARVGVPAYRRRPHRPCGILTAHLVVSRLARSELCVFFCRCVCVRSAILNAFKRSHTLMLSLIYPSAIFSLRHRPCSRRKRSGIPRSAQSDDIPRRRLCVPTSSRRRLATPAHSLSRYRNSLYSVLRPKLGSRDCDSTATVTGMCCMGR